jgi:ribosome-associated heat shock protein Hsp15
LPARDPDAAGEIRLDKWLWHARMFRARSLAAAAVEGGQVRVNGVRVSRPGRTVRPGDTLTLIQGGRVRVLRILATGTRRGPAAEAAMLFLDLDAPSQAQQDAPPALE